MASKKYCDRCGSLITYHTELDMQPCSCFAGIRTVLSERRYDLCRVCTKDLKRFMKGERVDRLAGDRRDAYFTASLMRDI